MNVFWDVVTCHLIEVDRCFRGAYCPYHQVIALMMEAVNTSRKQI
jgi:hypothetical protein